MSQKTIDLACVGSSCVDVIMSVTDVFRFEMIDAHAPDVVKKYTAIEYSSKLNVSSVKFVPGGSASNVAANLGNLRAVKTAYIGKLGDDAMGKLALDDLANANVNLDSCSLTKDDATAVSVILITPLGKDRSILAYKGANNLLKPADIKEDFMAGCKNLQWTSLTSPSSIEAIEKCIDLVKRNGGNVYACPSISIIKNAHDAAVNLVKKSDFLALNKEELLELTWNSNLMSALRDALAMGPKVVACTDGGNGSLVTDGNTLVSAGVYPVEVADTTGAGDAFASGLILAHMSGLPLEQMVRYGAAMAAFECSVTGVRDGIPHDVSVLKDYIASHTLKVEVSSFKQS
ncbi:MAG: carbohydrate kinase family protein [Candidatus Lokiarchaeota archaeon]|nr:carbohydrate kinase family protein [Candidatus Lokiarchaeota archaeon]